MPVIQVENLSKRYLLGVNNAKRLLKDISAVGRSADPRDEFWALRDVDFSIDQGEVVGIIGKNGAGKSTLLKLLARVTGPTTGRIKLKGNLASLLEVGTGFHPEMTGRENVFLNGAIMGLRKREVEKRFDEIVSFSGVESYIDTPVKRYSSGMYVRLAFAVAAHLEPKILIVDEVLAVGDAEFQKKCLDRMKKISGEGRTVLFVSHNLNSVRTLCSRGIYLKQGRIVMDSNLEDCIQSYLHLDKPIGDRLTDGISINGAIERIDSIEANGSNSVYVELPSDRPIIDLCVRGQLSKSSRLILQLRILDHMGMPVALFSPKAHTNEFVKYPSGPFEVRERILLPAHSAGSYLINIYLSDPNTGRSMMIQEHNARFRSKGSTDLGGETPFYEHGHGFVQLDSYQT